MIGPITPQSRYHSQYLLHLEEKSTHYTYLSLHHELSDATRTKGIGGHGAENETSKVVVYMAILTIFNIPQLISRFGLGSELLHFNFPPQLSII